MADDQAAFNTSAVVGNAEDLKNSLDGKTSVQLYMHTEENIDQVLEIFLDISTDKDLARQLAQLFIGELKKIEQLFLTQTTYNFYASSLLFVYDAEGAKNNKSLGSEHLKEFLNVKMIDFAHVWPAEEGKIDQNYLKGVQSLIKLFSNV